MITKDVVFATVADYDWPKMRAWATSLATCGFTGDKVVLTDNSLTEEAKLNLYALGFKVLNHDYLPRHRFVIRSSFLPAVNFLEQYAKNYRFAVWTDVRDLVFQSSPTQWLSRYHGQRVLVGSGEGWRIEDEKLCNAPWAEETTPHYYPFLKHHEACCGGTVAGDAYSMSDLLRNILEMVSGNEAANDQAALNYLLRAHYNNISVVPEPWEGWAVACAAYRTASFHSQVEFNRELLIHKVQPLFAKECGAVYTPNGVTPYAIVHQYDRDERWKKLIEEKYK